MRKFIFKRFEQQSESGQRVALITGASSGIGFHLAHEFARHNYNLLLVARDAKRLDVLKEECEAKYHVRVFALACDLSQIDSSLRALKNLIAQENIDIDTLVNNAGFGVHGNFSETNLNKEIDMVNLQTSSVLSLTKLILPNMIKKKHGAILNVGSVYSFTPVPYQAVYGACKSFLLSFSLSLSHEVKKYGIRVTALCPGTTKTEFRSRSKVQSHSKISKGMEPEQVAKIAYIALEKGELICIPGLTNKFLIFAASLFPSQLLASIISFINDKRGVNHSKSGFH